ncbi:MAG: type I pantothenate kinase [Rhodoblastus sp.]
MDERVGQAQANGTLSPYRHFTRSEWAALRADTPLTLTIEDLTKLQSINDPMSVEEVIAIYLPLSRLLALYVAATQGLFKATQRFLGAEDGKVPYIIGVAGSVAAGKSTTARVLQALLSRWPNTPNVQLVTTDGFLFPNAILERDGLMEKKGFPESYDQTALIRFLSHIKAGQPRVEAPVYSHLTYDVIPGESVVVDRPDILIVEGVNVLQPSRLSRDANETPFVSDFFDFSVYLHADDADTRSAGTSIASCDCARPPSATRNPISASMRTSATTKRWRLRRSIWSRINLRNLHENIFPTRARASLVLTKGDSHRIEQVALRKL